MQDNIFKIGALRSDFSDTGIFGALNGITAKRNEKNDNYDKALTRFPAETPVAMAYVPLQFFEEEYEPSVAFQNGTLFPELNKPFTVGGVK